MWEYIWGVGGINETHWRSLKFKLKLKYLVKELE
jgi:hypothetical protein